MKNPLQNIIQELPYTESILDLELVDKLMMHFPTKITNLDLCILLDGLVDAKLIQTKYVNFPSTPGTLVLIKRL